MAIQQEALTGVQRSAIEDPARTRGRRSRTGSAIFIFLLIAGGGAAYHFLNQPPQAAANSAPPPPSVMVSRPLEKTLAPTVGFLGQLSAVNSVEIRAQVSGYLTEYHFTDGQKVHKGDLLFVIDPRPYQIQYEQAKAGLRTAEAQLDLANQEFWRARELKQRNFGSGQNVDQRTQQQRGAEAAVDQARAAIRAAELNLEFTHITAPFDGKISARRVSVGSLVNGGSNGASGGTNLLTTLVSLDPIYLDFEMSENDYRTYMRAHGKPTDKEAPLIDIILDDEAGTAIQGRLDFLDNAVERSSGTLRARATIANPDFALTPGQFARLRVPIGAPRPTLLVPPEAVAADQSHEIVMVVDKDNKVVPKPIRTGPLVDGLRVVKEGLSPDDRVIIKGLMRARPGATVTPEQGTITAKL